MDHLFLIGTVTLIHLLAVMSPGPDFLIVMKHSLTYSRKSGIWTSIGIGTGIMIHIFYSLLGLGLLINNTPVLYNVIKYAGAVYLLYLGINSLITRVKDVDFTTGNVIFRELSPLKSFYIGFLTNVLNPKATLFFLSLFTLVIGPETPNGVMLVIGIILVVDTILWFILLSYLITMDTLRKVFNSYQKLFNQVFGILLIAIAIKIAFF